MLSAAGVARARALACVVAAAFAAAACGRTSEPQRIVLVSIDTLRADHVGCYGAAHATTPTLDALAARGARFDAAISPAPLTLPSHATLLTALDPPEHGARNNGGYRLSEGPPTLAERMQKVGFATAGFVSAFVLERRFGLARGFDHYDDRLGVHDDDVAIAARSATETIDAVQAWLETAPSRFFLFVHLYDPHAPYEPPEPYRSRQLGRPYDGEIAYADAEVGRLLAALGERFALAETLVVVTADHGESLGEHGENTHAFTLYDATQRVPLILAGPGVPPGREVGAVVRLADVAPTLLELGGLPAFEAASGRSLAPLLAGEAEAEPRVAWVETLATQLELGWSPLLGVRTAEHKYVRAPRPELYALADDPGETRNLAAELPELAAELDALVEARVAGQQVTPNLSLDPSTAEQLRALGYVAESERAPTRPLGVVGGPDPKDEMHQLETLRELLTFLQQRRGREALALFAKLGEVGTELELLRGEAALLAAELDIARAAALRARRAAPASAAPLLLEARVAERAGQLDAAESAFRAAERLDPAASGAAVGLGRIAEARGDRAGARAHYERARAAGLVAAEAIWRLAALEIEDGAEERARAALAALPQGLARTAAAVARLARAERAIGRLDLAQLRLAGALRAAPDSPELRLLEADLLEDAGDFAGAAATRRRVLDAAPGDPAASLAVARSLALTGGDLPAAEVLARGAAGSLGRSPETLESLAIVRTSLGDFEGALALADEGLAAGPREPIAAGLRLERALALEGLGREREAEAAWAEATRGASTARTERARAVLERLRAGSRERAR